MKGLKDKKTNRYVRNLADKNCLVCEMSFHPRTSKTKLCSTSCKAKHLSKLFDKKVVIACSFCKRPLALKIVRINGSDNLFCNSRCYGNWMSQTGFVSGEKNHFWEGGKTNKNTRIRSTAKYKCWRQEVFKRDNWTCQGCSERGGILHADHIKAFAYFPELRFELSNGRTLCIGCHKKTDSYLKHQKHVI